MTLKIKSRIKKIEKIISSQNIKPFFLVTPINGETNKQAVERHLEENPEDREVKICVIDNSINWERS